jgi:hypothetical protein
MRITVAGASAQTLVDWTEAPGPLGLGYPVPIPVDTPLPFDGFRTYAGLHARHQELELDNDWIVSEVVGQTRKGRDIRLYRLGDSTNLDVEGRIRPVIFINGGIHAREWQSPEVTTGLMELLAQGHDDGHWLTYLIENVSFFVIPVLNIDGFLQTQRYPRSNWIGADPTNAQFWPRDGRMRRKNLFNADEDLGSTGDHLFGVDLNRNNGPFWPGPPTNRDPRNLLYSGIDETSESETQALKAAADRVPAGALRFYADMHSFGRVMFSVNTGNARRSRNQSNVLRMARLHHSALPGAKLYSEVLEAPGLGIGTTSEYFAYRFQVPSITWELEPGAGGTEYGGFGTNGHDGFILPESQVRRVRENMAQSIVAVGYHMAGPPHLMRVQVVAASGSDLIIDQQWRLEGQDARVLQHRQLRGLEPGREYAIQATFNKPMRWRDADGAIVPFPGQPAQNLDVVVGLTLAQQELALETSPIEWLRDPPTRGQAGRSRYRDDAFKMRFSIVDSIANRVLLQQALDAGSGMILTVSVRDMTGRLLDADPSTATGFASGGWSGYETASGQAGDVGGTDTSQSLPVSLAAQSMVFPIDPGHSATWFDPARDGEGFVLENLDGERAIAYWFTYDEVGAQRWLTGIGFIDGNRVRFPDLFATTGGRFGAQFDPAAIRRTRAGSGDFWFSGCDSGWFDFQAFGQHGTFELSRTSRTMGVDCDPAAPAGGAEAAQSGSWYDLTHDGEGFAVQWMTDGRAIMTWYSFDPDGNPFWMLGVGERQGDEIVFPDVHATRGGRFGGDFDPEAVERFRWGELRMRLGCAIGTATYESVLPVFGSGTFQLQRLSSLDGLACAP